MSHRLKEQITCPHCGQVITLDYPARPGSDLAADLQRVARCPCCNRKWGEPKQPIVVDHETLLKLIRRGREGGESQTTT
jgi:hypothetical protein